MFDSVSRQRILSAVFLTFALSASASAARRAGSEEPESRPTRVGVFAEEVVWQPLSDFDGATLLLSAPDGEIRRWTFAAGVSPTFRLADLKSAPADGRYFWEIRLRPRLSPELREELAKAAEADDPVRIDALNRTYGMGQEELVQAGQFLVRGGRIEADPNDLDGGDRAVGRHRATSSPTPKGPLAAFDVTGDWTITGNLGVGTDTPSQELDIVDVSPTIQMQDNSPSFNFNWFINGTDDGFDVRRTGNATSDRVFFLDPAAPRPSIWVDSLGRWGNGTSLPSFPLHVVRSDGTARILVDEDFPMVTRRTLFELENNGGVDFRLRNSNTGANWFFSQDSADNFVVSLSGTGGPEFLVRGNGRVQMGPGASTVFDLLPGGNLTIGGVLTESSDRDAKENFQSVDAAEILGKVAALPLSTWNLKTDPDRVRHLGPTAQDFQAAFGLGQDPRHIAEVDRSGVALAAIQGLNQARLERDAELAALRLKVESQGEEIESLKARLEALESLRVVLAEWIGTAARPVENK